MLSKRDAIAMLVLAALGLACVWLATGCSELNAAEGFVSDHGTVYVCDTEQGCPGGPPDEYCWSGSRHELERLLGAACHEESIDERAWPAIVGCAYCCGDGCGRGANAHCGAVCP